MGRKINIFLAVLICSLIWERSSAEDSVEVILNDHVLIGGGEIKLGDVAVLSGGDERRAEKLRSVRLCSAPPPGDSRELDRSYIEKRLAQNTVGLSHLSFSGAGKVIVRTACAEVTGSQIQAAVEDLIYQRLPREDVILEFRRLPQKLILPHGEVNLRASAADDLPFNGNRVVYVEIFVDGKRHKKIPVSLKVRTFGEVLLCRKKVDRHHVFESEDVSVERRETTTLPDDVMTRIDDVVGKMAKSIVQSGRVIRRDMIELPPVIHRGDLVIVEFSLKGIFITMEGEARADGRPGEVITVRNIRSRREVSARVVDSKTVVVDSGFDGRIDRRSEITSPKGES